MLYVISPEYHNWYIRNINRNRIYTYNTLPGSNISKREVVIDQKTKNPISRLIGTK